MKFKELFDREFLFESKKDDAKALKIFYRFDINIKKIDGPEENPASGASQTPLSDLNTQPTPASEVPTAAPPAEVSPAETPPTEPAPAAAPDLSNIPLSSVVTEDDKKNDEDVQISDENSIVRKLSGEVVLSKEEVDTTQTLDDIITKLSESKKDGTDILDEFTSDILTVMADPNLQPQLKEKMGKESQIFAEIVYGKKMEDSVGVRFIKRKNSDLITTSLMIDNSISGAKYSKEIIDKRIADIRNDELSPEDDGR